MDIYTVKLALMNLISNSDSRLQPRQTHILANWHIQSWQLTMDTFPIVTVRMQGKQTAIYGFKPPNVPFGELYYYDFSLYVFGDSMWTSREIADNVIDYLGANNKVPTSRIIDIVGLTIKENIPIHGPKRYWRTVITGRIITEESLT